MTDKKTILNKLFFKNKRHEKFCESQDTEYPEPLVTISAKIFFKIPSIIRGDFNTDYLVNLNNYKKDIILENELYYDNYGGGVSPLIDSHNNGFSIDIEWVYNSVNYINNLPIEDKFTILGYTSAGDALVNLLIRDNKTRLSELIENYIKKGKHVYYLPIFFQMKNLIANISMESYLENNAPDNLLKDIKAVIKTSKLEDIYNALISNLNYFTPVFYIDCITAFSKDLSRIISNSPPMTKTSILYRGVKDKYYYSDPSNKTFYSTTFMSTSYNPDIAIGFTSGKDCCIKKIIAGPGTKALFMESNTQTTEEFEVLLNSGTEFSILEDGFKAYRPSEKTDLSHICDTDNVKLKNITTMEVINRGYNKPRKNTIPIKRAIIKFID